MADTHKIAPTNPRLAALLADVERGNIKIPVFQREFVWEDEQIMSLLDSIYQGYPVGSLLLWSTKEVLNHERNVGGFSLPITPEDYPVNYVLDGQQRLTTLFGVFNSNAKTSDAALADRFNICFVPDEQIFVHHSDIESEKAINLRTILDTTHLLPELTRFTGSQQQAIAVLTERFKDYEFPVVTIRDRTNQEVCRIFQRINSSGTRLSTLELLAAWTWSDEFDLRRELETLLEDLSSTGYDTLDQSLLMRCLAAIALKRIDPDELVDMQPTELVNAVLALKQSIHLSVDFLETELQIRNAVFLPFPIMLVPLVFFYSRVTKPNAAQTNGLRRWFWHCAFTQRYRAGTNKMVMTDLERMEKLASTENEFESLSATVDRALFTRTWRINSAAAKAAICLLAQRHPRSFLTGKAVDLGTTLAAYNARQFHHIYPKGYLADHGLQFHEANQIANLCLLTSTDNRTISDSSPANYFQDIPAEQKSAILHSAFIPSEFQDGDRTYADFLTARTEELAKSAEKLIENGTLP